MSGNPTERQQEPDGSEPVGRRSSTTPRPPVVQFCSEDPLQVYYSVEKSVHAAQAGPDDEFFDIRGIRLALRETADGSACLEAHGEGDRDALKQRVLVELRAAIEAAAPEADVAAAAEEVIRWAAQAPDVEHMVHALWFPDDDNGEELVKPCKWCSWPEIAVKGVPPCCPGAR